MSLVRAMDSPMSMPTALLVKNGSSLPAVDDQTAGQSGAVNERDGFRASISICALFKYVSDAFRILAEYLPPRRVVAARIFDQGLGFNQIIAYGGGA
jgi:hypothetical protein